MSDIRKTKSGWILEITNKIYGQPEIGGIAGREVLYKRETLNRLGIDYNDDPGSPWNEDTSIENYLHRAVAPDKVLKAGRRIS